jgi:hypothetical protein
MNTARIVGNLSITGTKTTSSGWDIGAPEFANCGRNIINGPRFADTIGGDANGLTGPGFGHDLTLTGNTNTTLTDNNIVHNCTQSTLSIVRPGDLAPTTADSDAR